MDKRDVIEVVVGMYGQGWVDRDQHAGQRENKDIDWEKCRLVVMAWAGDHDILGELPYRKVREMVDSAIQFHSAKDGR